LVLGKHEEPAVLLQSPYEAAILLKTKKLGLFFMLPLDFGSRLLGELDDNRAGDDKGIRIEPYNSPRCHAGEQMAVEVSDEGISPTIIYLNTDSASAFFRRNPHLSKNRHLKEVFRKVRKLGIKQLAVIAEELDVVRKRFKDFLPQNFDITPEKVQKDDPRVFRRLLHDYPNIDYLRVHERASLAEYFLLLYRKYSDSQDRLRQNYPGLRFFNDGNPNFYSE
jgi:hypothetical protein